MMKHRFATAKHRRNMAGFTFVELVVGTAILVMLALAAASVLKIITRRINNDHTRYTLSTENARAAHVITELARRATSVAIYANLAAAQSGSAPVSRGDTMAFLLPDGTKRWISFEDNSLNLYTTLGGTLSPMVLAGGTPGRIVTRVGIDVHFDYTQGLPRAVWLAQAQTTLGWTEQITYSAFAVTLHNR